MTHYTESTQILREEEQSALKDKHRNEILDAGMKLCLSIGVADVDMKEIEAAARVGRAALDRGARLTGGGEPIGHGAIASGDQRRAVESRHPEKRADDPETPSGVDGGLSRRTSGVCRQWLRKV